MALAGLLSAPAVAACAAWSLAGSGEGPEFQGARIGLTFLLGAALLAPWLGRAGAGAIALEVAAIVLVALAAGGLGALAGLEGGPAFAATLILLAGLVVPWAWASVARSLGWPTAARLVFLCGVAVISGTAYLVRSAAGELPPWIVSWNPLARVLGGPVGLDWFHGPTLYPRVGEGYYRYPEMEAEIAAPLVSALLALVAAAAIARARRRHGGPTSP
jgi:hypothetical protein